MTEDGTFDYTWNGENLLIQVEPSTATTNDLRLTFSYPVIPPGRRETALRDYPPSPRWLRRTGMGRRVQKVEEEYDGSSWSTNAVTKFVWDGWLLIAELDGLDSDALTRTYTWGLDLSGTFQGAGGIGGLLVVDDDAGDGFCGYYAYDGNGNVGQVLDAEDLSTDTHYEYDPYGREIVATGTYADANPWRFSTKWLDAIDPTDDDASLLYFGFRYLSPRLGRWVSRDPMGEDGGCNLLVFAGSDPVNAVDPKGRSLLTATPYCCPEDDPTVPEKDCEEICQIARDRGLGEGEQYASVVCYGHHKMCPCILDMPTLGAPLGQCPELESIILRHERKHIPQSLPCSQCGVYLATPASGLDDPDNLEFECPARHDSYGEVAELLKATDLHDPCFEPTKDLLVGLLIFLNTRCEERYRVEMPSFVD